MKGNTRLAVKVLELLVSGFALGFARGRARRRSLHAEGDVIWQTIDRKQLYQILERWKLQGVIAMLRDAHNQERIQLTNKGKARVLKNHFRSLRIKTPRRWDGKWRLVIFDIPETKRRVRDALRRKLKELGFLEFQKSVFVHPYRCTDEIHFVVNFFDAEEHVYTVEAPIHPDGKLRKKFGLSA